MVGHALQLTLLALSGGILARALGPIDAGHVHDLNRFGITGTLLSLVTLSLWLLPVSLDRALDHAAWEIAKFITLPLLLGLPLSRSWPRLPVVVRGVIWGNIPPMAVVMGWLYREAPERLCNNYLVNDQELFGLVLWFVAASVAGYWGLRALIGSQAVPHA